MGSAGGRESGNWDAVARAVKDRAVERGMTQQDVVTKSGVSLATVQELWRAKPRNRSARTLQAVSQALGWPGSYLDAVLHGESSGTDPSAESTENWAFDMRQEVRRLAERLDALEDRLRDVEQRNE